MVSIEEKEERIRDYLAGEMSQEEKNKFEREMETDEHIRHLFRVQLRLYMRIRWANRRDYLSEDEVMSRVLRRIRRDRLRSFMRYVAVVSFVSLVCFMLWKWEVGRKDVKTSLTILPLEGQEVPMLTLDGGEQIYFFPQDSVLFRSTGQADIRLTDKGSLEYSINTDSSAVSRPHYNKLVVPRGCEFNIILSDGSRVWLNAGSSLRFPERFVGTERMVFLEGEGYFEVAQDKSCPFIVKAGDMDLRVLGTSFNVKAYPDDEYVVTTLVTGKVMQHYAGIDTNIVLTPCRQSIFNRFSGNLRLEEVDVRLALAWREGRIVMDNVRLEDIFRELSRWYDFETVYTDNSLKDVRFYLHTNRYADIDQILEHLQTTRGVHFSRVDKKIYVSR